MSEFIGQRRRVDTSEFFASAANIEQPVGPVVIVTSQFPVEKWHAVVGDPALADAILDRLVHRAYQLNLKGESMRKRRNALTQSDHQSS